MVSSVEVNNTACHMISVNHVLYSHGRNVALPHCTSSYLIVLNKTVQLTLLVSFCSKWLEMGQ